MTNRSTLILMNQMLPATWLLKSGSILGILKKALLKQITSLKRIMRCLRCSKAHIEPHVVLTYWDEDDRLVIRTSTQVPFHVRRQIAPVLGLPIKRIRVIKPRIGGGFGGKQEVLIEDVAAHLTIATGRPVIYEMTREEEFTASRTRHPMRIHMKTGVKEDGTITANAMYCLSDTGAYGCHALTVAGNTGHKSMALYVGDGSYRREPQHPFLCRMWSTPTRCLQALIAVTACPRDSGLLSGIWKLSPGNWGWTP